MSAPQDSITAEGRSLAEAIQNAAQTLGVSPSLVLHELDREHFRAGGRSRGVDTIKIFAWARSPEEVTGGEDAREWLAGLIERMGLTGQVKLRIAGEKRAELLVDSPDGRHLVGRQGSTLKAIQLLLEATMKGKNPDWKYRIDILGGERREDRDGDDRGRDRDDRGRDDRRERGDRDDRGYSRDRDDRGRGRDRDDRGRGRDDRGRDDRRERGDRDDRGYSRDRDDRGRGRDDRGRGRDDRGRDRGGRRGEEDVAALERLARKLAEKVRETGEPVEIRQSLNSFERRIIHVTVSEIPGVATESFLDGEEKRVRLLPASAEE